MMGREIRRVPLGWEHPKKEYPNHRTQRMEEGFQPLYDESYITACVEWKKDFAEWEGGKRQEEFADSGNDYEYWDWNGMPPDKDYYRPDWTDEEINGIAVYETVSEGTPVTPTFATTEELVDYLVANGDYWDQKRGDGGWDRRNATAFVTRGFAPSMIVDASGIKMARDMD